MTTYAVSTGGTVIGTGTSAIDVGNTGAYPVTISGLDVVLKPGYSVCVPASGSSVTATAVGGTGEVEIRGALSALPDGGPSPVVHRLSVGTLPVNTVTASGATETLTEDYGVHVVTMTANCTFTFPTAVAGRRFWLHLKQDATGSRLATWPANARFSGGTKPTLTTTATTGADTIYFICSDGTNWDGIVTGQAWAVPA
jgi:hypothetical protein